MNKNVPPLLKQNESFEQTLLQHEKIALIFQIPDRERDQVLKTTKSEKSNQNDGESKH